MKEPFADLEQWCLERLKSLTHELGLMKDGVTRTSRQHGDQMLDTTEATIKSYEVAIADLAKVIIQIRGTRKPKGSLDMDGT